MNKNELLRLGFYPVLKEIPKNVKNDIEKKYSGNNAKLLVSHYRFENYSIDGASIPPNFKNYKVFAYNFTYSYNSALHSIFNATIHCINIFNKYFFNIHAIESGADDYFESIGSKEGLKHFIKRRIGVNVNISDRYSFIYVLKHENYYKIGRSKKVQSRVDTLKTLTPFVPEVYAIFRTKSDQQAKELEKNIHERYKEKRVNGEWFEMSVSDIANMFGYTYTFIDSRVFTNVDSFLFFLSVAYQNKAKLSLNVPNDILSYIGEANPAIEKLQ